MSFQAKALECPNAALFTPAECSSQGRWHPMSHRGVLCRKQGTRSPRLSSGSRLGQCLSLRKDLPPASPGLQSGLIVEIPAAEPAVGRHREHLDANAPLGIPAHITVLFPFMAPETIDKAVLTRLQSLFTEVSRFSFQLDHTDWFGDTVLWLGPHDPRPFQSLTEHVFENFPAFPPFGGRFDDVVPHLTVGHGHPPEDLRIAEKSVRKHLPIEGRVAAVTLIIQQSAGAQLMKAATFTLA
jgi:2'-5' RNA ligase